jgi:hypothetical protein
MHSRLADVADVRTGFPFRGKVMEDPSGKLAVVQMKDISDAGLLEASEYLRINEEPAHSRHLLKQGDVLLQSRGTKFPAGVVDTEVHGIAALGLHVIRPGERLLPTYLAWVLNHPVSREAIRGVARGSYIPFLSKGDLADLKIPVPPIQTQHQIVEVARLEREAARIAAQLQVLRDQHSAAVTWRAATRN